MLHSLSKQAEKAFCIPLFFFLAFFYLRAHSIPFFICVSNELWIERKSERSLHHTEWKIVGEKKKKKKKKRRGKAVSRCTRERERKRVFFCCNSRKVETKRRHRRERGENKSGTSFHLILLLISVTHWIGHGHEHRTASNDCTNDKQ